MPVPVAAAQQLPIWNPSENLSDRVKRLRDEYFSFDSRSFRNEVMPFSTGTPWDSVFMASRWTIVPEIMPFIRAYADSLLAAAVVIPLPGDFWHKPLPIRVATFFHDVLARHLPVNILEGELIVGGQFNAGLSLCLTRREARKLDKKLESFRRGVVRASDLGIGNCGAVPGHLIPDYPRVLRQGFEGILTGIEAEIAREQDPGRRYTLESFAIACRGALALSDRYADEAERLAVTADPTRAGELHEIARICRKVPRRAASTFHEALQSLWFTHMLIQTCESYPGAGTSFGRFDQFLFPYYDADIASGRMSRDWARELLRCFWVKPNYAYDFQGRVGRNQGITSSFGQLVTLSGCGPNGEDMTNDLTWLCLDVIEEMNLLEPKPNVRIHDGTPDALLKRVCQLVAKAQGSPFLLNFDETSMRGLRWGGLPEEDLWNYAPVGCLENTRQGDDRSGTVDVNLNLAKPVELVMFQGRDQKTGEQLGPRTPDPRTMGTWDEFERAFRKQLSFCLQHLIDLTNRADSARAQYAPTPYLSALVGGCIENRTDVTSGGARFNFITVEGVALATAADSLSAVKCLVFEEKRVSMGNLIAALEADFDNDEPLRQLLLNRAPKYGNDEPEADRMARDITRWWAEEAAASSTPLTGKRYRGGYLSWNYGIAYAPNTASTPDGRRRGTYLSNGVAAVPGMDRRGPTAAACSVGHLGLEVIPNGSSHTMSLSPSLLRDEAQLTKLGAFLRGYCRQGGSALQVNMVDIDTLRAAQKDPETYRNLLVRVTGYNAYFTNLGREMQEEIIAREAHRL
ncbi:MAG TPA: pyruvate formate lyase family protein [Candidatus Hydrogenedentes bacterium]|nr:pyruvate formate lyase family protein [Candidatus Hydrogenedentota bacterium]